MFAFLFLLAPFTAIPLWLLAIRPYCLKNREGYTPGGNIFVSMWIDWQHAAEIAKMKGDSFALFCCRLFGFIHVLAVIGFVGVIFSG